jgi:3',5'-cyclic-AMP phosphodiesterase
MWIAQVSDTHIQPHGLLSQGTVDSNAMFATAVGRINALDPLPDLVLLRR